MMGPKLGLVIKKKNLFIVGYESLIERNFLWFTTGNLHKIAVVRVEEDIALSAMRTLAGHE